MACITVPFITLWSVTIMGHNPKGNDRLCCRDCQRVFRLT
nr:hypothetical protein 348p1_00055 [Serratia grimesii]